MLLSFECSILLILSSLAFQVVLVVQTNKQTNKHLTSNTGEMRDVCSIPGLGRFPGGGNGNHFSILAWRIPGTEELGGLQSMVLQESDVT